MVELKKVYNESCLETMKRMEDKSVDLVMADFPYGIGEEYDEYVDSQENLQVLINDVVPELRRVAKIVFITCGVINVQLYPKYDWCMSWVNKAGTGSTSWGFNCWQPIIVYGKDPYLANGLGRRADMIETNDAAEKNGHPCPKPIKFWSKLLHRGSVKETDIVYDPFFGSGTTGIVCEKYKRKWLGSEISKKYCAISKKELIPYQITQQLF